MSKFVIRASDNTGSTSSDHELQESWKRNEHNLKKAVEKMFASEDRVDNSLLNLFRIMIASRYGKSIGADGIREAYEQGLEDDDDKDEGDQTKIEVEQVDADITANGKVRRFTLGGQSRNRQRTATVTSEADMLGNISVSEFPRLSRV